MVVFFLFVFVYFSQRVIVAELRNDCEHSGWSICWVVISGNGVL